MDIDSNTNQAHSKQKHSFLKIKKLLKPLFPKNSKKTVDKNSKMPIYLYRNHGLKLFSIRNFGKVSVTTSLKTHDTYNDDDSINSIGTWTSEKEDDDISYNSKKDNDNDNDNILFDTFDSNEKTSVHDLMNATSSVSSELINISSNHTLYIKDNNNTCHPHTNHPLQHCHDFCLESESDSDNCSFLSDDSVSTPSTFSIGSFNNKYYINTNNIKNENDDNSNNNNNNKNINININDTHNLPPSPPSTPTCNNQHPKTETPTTNTTLQKYSKIKTPPILSYFPSEILIHIAMSSDFDTLLNLRQTCRFFYNILSLPCNWTDYWKYTSDHVECLNSLVTSVYQSDEYIFGEVLEPLDDKFIIFDRRKDYRGGSSSSSSSSFPQEDHIPNFIYKMSNDAEKEEIPIERILFIDSFSTRFGFSYLGGLRIYVPYEYGNVIVHFYDRPASELPCSLEHYQEYERNQLKLNLSSVESQPTDLPHSLKNCPQCFNYFRRNCIDYTVTCSGRPVSHISAIWKYHVTSRYTFSLDIINSRSENGYGYRTQDAFIHTNYSFLINDQELSPGKAALFRKFILKSDKI